jgi:hypothetical protein
MVRGWCHRAIMSWWITHRLDDHVIFRFGSISPRGITRIIIFRRRRVVIRGWDVFVVGLRVIVEHG